MGTGWLQPNRPANRCRCLFAATHKRVAGRRCCRKHSGVPRNSASLLGTLHQKSYGAQEETDRERSVQNRSDSTSSSLREMPQQLFSASLYRPSSRPVMSTLFPVPVGQGSAPLSEVVEVITTSYPLQPLDLKCPSRLFT